MSRDKILGSEEIEVFNFLKAKFMGDAIIAGGAVRDMIMGKPFKDVDIWFSNTKVGVPQRFFEISLPKELGFKCGEDYIDIPLNFSGEAIRIGNDEFLAPGRPDLEDEAPIHPRFRNERELRPRSPWLATATSRARPEEVEVSQGSLMNSIIGESAPTLGGSTDDFSGAAFQAPLKKKHRVVYMFSMYYKGIQYQLMNIDMPPKQFVREAFDIGFCKAMHDGRKIITTEAFDKDKENKTLTLDGKLLGPMNFKWALEKHIPRILALYPEFKPNVLSYPPEQKAVPSYTTTINSVFDNQVFIAPRTIVGNFIGVTPQTVEPAVPTTTTARETTDAALAFIRDEQERELAELRRAQERQMRDQELDAAIASLGRATLRARRP